MSRKTELTFGDIQQQVEKLLEHNGTTTTLDIKKALRAKGFWATQGEIARSMYTLWPLYQWHWTFNGTFRTYFPNLEAAIEDYIENGEGIHQTSWLGWLVSPFDNQDDDEDDVSDTVSPYTQPILDKASLVQGSPEITTAPSPGDWVAFSYSQAEPPTYVTGVTLVTSNGASREKARMTVRNVVRNFYAELEHVPYADVGANIIK